MTETRIAGTRASRRRLLGLGLLAAVLLAGASPARAARVDLARNTFLDLHLLLQPSVQLREDVHAAPQFGSDFYVRRTRFVMAGQVTKWLSFFAETDQPNWGKGGDWTPAFFVQDAFLSLNVHEALVIDGGMLLVPFVHNARQGATSLHSLDYHSDLIRYPTGSNKVWRDNGVEIRGLLLDRRLNYYVAITQGVGKTPHDTPRVSGRLAVNFFDAEDAFFLSGTYLGKKRILSVGAAFDFQQGSFGPGTTYAGVGGDIFLDFPLKHRRRVSGQIDVVYYGGGGNPDRGTGLLFDLGYAVGPFEPLVAVDWFRPDGATQLYDNLVGIHGGFNWWAIGHTANLKIDAGFVKGPQRPMRDSWFVLTIQAQLYL
jgi:hypothetical protein